MKLRSMPDLADRIKYIRRLNNLSQAEMAALAKTTQQAIQQAESGKAQNPRYLHKLAKALDIPFEWLSMNILSDEGKKSSAAGLAEREVLNNFYAMPRKEQELMLQLMKSRKKK